MERYLYTSMTGALHTLTAQRIHANNLANSGTTGFRRDMESAASYQVEGPGLATQWLSRTEKPVTDFSPGRLESTGRELDVGIRGEGFIAVLDRQGNEAYTRAGHLQVDEEGRLVSLGRELAGGLVVPDHQAIHIGTDGTVSVTPPGGGQLEVGQIKLVNPPAAQLFKGEDGLFRLQDNAEAPVAPEVRLTSGHLEQSNVNAVDELISTMSLSRTFEIQLRMMKAADENCASGNRLVRGA